MVEVDWTPELVGDLAKATEGAKASQVVTFNFIGYEMSVEYAEALLDYLTEAYAHTTLQ